MTKDKSLDAVNVGEQPPSDLTPQKKKNIPATGDIGSRDSATLNSKSANRKNSVSDDEAALLSRKKLVAAREKTVNAREIASEAREDSVLVREGAAQTREEETNSREDIAAKHEVAMQLTQVELQLKSSEHTAMLQEANTRLVCSGTLNLAI